MQHIIDTLKNPLFLADMPKAHHGMFAQWLTDLQAQQEKQRKLALAWLRSSQGQAVIERLARNQRLNAFQLERFALVSSVKGMPQEISTLADNHRKFLSGKSHPIPTVQPL